MGQIQVSERKYTVAEYFQMEEKSETRNEYYDGEIFAMAGTTMNHNDIVDNVRTFLKDLFRPNGFSVFAENKKLRPLRTFTIHILMLL